VAVIGPRRGAEGPSPDGVPPAGGQPRGPRLGFPGDDVRVVEAVKLHRVVHGGGYQTGVVSLGEDLDPKDVGAVTRRDAERRAAAVRDAPDQQLGEEECVCVRLECH